MKIKDSTVVVTGAGRGIGLALAFRLANLGAKLALTDIVQVDLDEAVKACRAEIVKPIPVGRLGQSDEVAHAAQFIIENDFFTGRCVDLDGGHRL